MRHVSIIGGGVGGLASAALLSAQGVKVDVYEKDSKVGGRSSKLRLNDFVFDTGPTFLLYKPLLDELFALMGENPNDYLKFQPLDPLYHLIFKDFVFKPSQNKVKTLKEITRLFPGNEKGYERFLSEQEKKFGYIEKIMRMPFDKPYHYLHPNILKGAPHINPFRSIMGQLQKYFNDEELVYASAFQSKYLGLSPYKTPALFTVLSFLEHFHGLYHVDGGLNEINQAFKKIIIKNGGAIHLNTPVKKVHVKDKKITHITLENNQTAKSDAYFLNADFAHAMLHMFDEKTRKPYSNKKLSRMNYSLSTFNIYLGLNKKFNQIAHHNVIFSESYRDFINDITTNKLPKTLSLYVHNPSLIDPSLAPEGKSALYVLVPVPNLDASIDWKQEKNAFFDKIIEILEHKYTIKNLKSYIETMKIITPNDWEQDYNVHKGAVFNLAHNYSQMLYKRPHNQFNSINNLFLTGGGTHPGSGLPTIYLSAMISTKLYLKSS